MTNDEIIKIVYQIDDQGHYIGGYNTLIECPDWLQVELLLHHSTRFLYLLFSKYNGMRYLPERFL